MDTMFIKTPEDGYHFFASSIATIADQYGARYMGYWPIKNGYGWAGPVDVFYQPNPDTSKGHSHYFGMYRDKDGEVMITNAESAFSEPITGLLTDDGEVLVSRHRHDFVSKGDYFIDGGRDYVRSSVGPFVAVTVKDGEFVFGVD